MVVAQNLGFLYHNHKQALLEINFRIKPGEMVALLGANGAGKTTMFKVMLGLLSPYQGTLTLSGLSVKPDNLKRLYKKAGYLFQNSDDQLFMPTVFDDVAYGPNNLGTPADKIKTLVEESLAAVGMPEAASLAIHTLSAGQKKRVALAGILAMQPDLMLLDEPTAGLDPAGVNQIMGLLKELNQRRNLTILMATHQVELLPTFMDQVLVLDQGKLIKQGTPEEVFSCEQSLQTAHLQLPEIAQLMQALKREHNFDWDKFPLTVQEAQTFLRQHMPASTCP